MSAAADECLHDAKPHRVQERVCGRGPRRGRSGSCHGDRRLTLIIGNDITSVRLFSFSRTMESGGVDPGHDDDGAPDRRVRPVATRLTGTLALPTTAGPHPGALLLSGSGPLDRDSNTARMRLDVSKAVAAGLLSHGIASLRYDKRGVGQSGGDYLSDRLRRRDRRRSCGAGFAARPSRRRRRSGDRDRTLGGRHDRDATRDSSMPPAGYVFLAGAAMTGQQVMEWQTRRIAATLPRRAAFGRAASSAARRDTAPCSWERRPTPPAWRGSAGTPAGSGSTWPTTRPRR